MTRKRNKKPKCDALLFVSEVAELLHVGESMARRLMSNGTIASTTNPRLFGNRLLAKRSDVTAYMKIRDSCKRGGWPRGAKRQAPRGKKALSSRLDGDTIDISPGPTNDV